MGYTVEEIQQLRGDDHIGSDGFVHPGARALVAAPSAFQTSPVERLRELFALRRKSVDYSLTHVGGILSARELSEARDWLL